MDPTATESGDDELAFYLLYWPQLILLRWSLRFRPSRIWPLEDHHKIHKSSIQRHTTVDFTIFCNAALWLPFLLLFGLRAVKLQLSTKRNVSMISLNQTSKRSPCICEFLEEKVCTELALVIPLFAGGSCYRLQRSLITRFSWLTKWFFSCSLVGKIWMKQFGILSQLFKPYEWMYRLLFWNKFCICASQIIYWLLYVF